MEMGRSRRKNQKKIETDRWREKEQDRKATNNVPRHK